MLGDTGKVLGKEFLQGVEEMGFSYPKLMEVSPQDHYSCCERWLVLSLLSVTDADFPMARLKNEDTDNLSHRVTEC